LNSMNKLLAEFDERTLLQGSVIALASAARRWSELISTEDVKVPISAIISVGLFAGDRLPAPFERWHVPNN
jgi:hypothetical protein